MLTSKSMSYLVPAQLALSQFPATFLPALVGWIIGYAYRYEVLPGADWRIPGGNSNSRRRIEGLRRRLENERIAVEAVSSGVDRHG